MKIALINENSQAAKNGIIEAALKKVVEPMGHEVVNYGMYAADDAAQLTYVQCGILAAILLTKKPLTFIISSLHSVNCLLTGIGEEAGIANIIRGLDQAIAGTENIKVLLETMSGKGTEIGYRFEQLKQIRDGVQHPERIGICLDTCHVFAAGYDIVHDLDGVLDEFDRILGLELLRTIHLNDSLMPFGSRKDRHAVIGEGEIGLEALLNVLRHPKLKDLPFYLETPLDDAGHKEEIARLKEYLDEE